MSGKSFGSRLKSKKFISQLQNYFEFLEIIPHENEKKACKQQSGKLLDLFLAPINTLHNNIPS